ncbi:MAG TPA: MmgE/PrpD family protein [Desulfobacterales bacterium]|nr:MmgE/PrpD family protein [Desulfobacterales bacterium]
MTILDDAAEFARSASFRNIPEEVFAIGKRALIDFLGLALRGSREAVSRIVQSYVGSMATTPESKVFGTNLSVSRNLAALANGVSGHSLDFDDVSWTTLGHPTVTIAPSVFATGEVVKASGKEILSAYAVGVEVAHKIAALVMPQTSSNGWHTTSVFGPLGAAAASAQLMALEKDPFTFALGIATSTAGGLRANFGTMTKPYHAGMAAFNGTTSAILAGMGLTAARNAIEATDGFGQVFSGGRLEKNTVDFGNPWDIVKPGLVFKKYPCCSGAHPAIDCLLEILHKTPFTPDQLESISVGVSQLGPLELVCHDPGTVTEARFSMEYALAVAVRYGKVGLEQFESSCINDPQVKELIPKIQMELDPEFSPLGLIGTAPAKLHIVLKDGRTLDGRCDLAKGNPEKPLTDGELSSKFLECVSDIITPQNSKRILKDLFAFEKIDDINSILKMI